jgi:hypothetical protein
VQKIEDIYRERLKLLIQEVAGGSQAKFSAITGKSPAQISQWVNASRDSKTGKPRSLDRNTARLLEAKAGKPEGWMDQPLTLTASEPRPPTAWSRSWPGSTRTTCPMASS